MEIREVFARNLKALRDYRQVSQEELAGRADLDRTYISSLERCLYSPTLDVVDKIAKALDVPPHELLMPAPPWSEQPLPYPKD